MKIRAYSPSDETKLFDLLNEERWTDYCHKSAAYERALLGSLTYVAYEGDILCGYVRCKDDDGFGITCTTCS